MNPYRQVFLSAPLVALVLTGCGESGGDPEEVLAVVETPPPMSRTLWSSLDEGVKEFRMARNSLGEVAAAWIAEKAGSSTVYAAFRDSDGVWRESRVSVPGDDAKTKRGFAIAIDSGGNAVTAWAQKDDQYYRPYVSFKNGTESWKPPFQLSQWVNRPEEADLQIEFGSGGRIYVVIAGHDAIDFHTYSTSPQFKIERRTAYLFTKSPHLAAGPMGRILMAYQETATAFHGSEAVRFVRRPGIWYDSSIHSWFNSSAKALEARPQISVANDGTAIMAFRRQLGTCDEILFSHYGDPNWTVPISLGDAGDGELRVNLHPESKRGVVAWRKGTELWVRRVNPCGCPVGEVESLTQNAGSVTDVVVGPTGILIACWIENGDVLSRRFDPATGVWSPPQSIDDLEGGCSDVRLTRESDGSFLATWRQELDGKVALRYLRIE